MEHAGESGEQPSSGVEMEAYGDQVVATSPNNFSASREAKQEGIQVWGGASRKKSKSMEEPSRKESKSREEPSRKESKSGEGQAGRNPSLGRGKHEGI